MDEWCVLDISTIVLGRSTFQIDGILTIGNVEIMAGQSRRLHDGIGGCQGIIVLQRMGNGKQVVDSNL